MGGDIPPPVERLAFAALDSLRQLLQPSLERFQGAHSWQASLRAPELPNSGAPSSPETRQPETSGDPGTPGSRPEETGGERKQRRREALARLDRLEVLVRGAAAGRRRACYSVIAEFIGGVPVHVGRV